MPLSTEHAGTAVSRSQTDNSERVSLVIVRALMIVARSWLKWNVEGEFDLEVANLSR